MYICYIDESGTSAIPGNTSHFVLAGLSLPIWHWKDCDTEIAKIKAKFQLEINDEIHTAWIARPYLEQIRIPNFKDLSYQQRRSQVNQYRRGELLRLQRSQARQYKQTKKELLKNRSLHSSGHQGKK